MNHPTLAAAACALAALVGVLLVFGAGWALIVGGTLGVVLVIGLRAAELTASGRGDAND